MWLKVWQYSAVQYRGLFLLRVSPRVCNFRLDLPLLHEKEARELDWAVKLGILLELQGTCTYLDCSS